MEFGISTYVLSAPWNEAFESPAGTVPPSCSTNDFKKSNCGKFKMLGFCEQKPTKSFNLFISSGPIGHDIFADCAFNHIEKKNTKKPKLD